MSIESEDSGHTIEGPEWLRQLELTPDDSAAQKLASIENLLASLTLPQHREERALASDELDETRRVTHFKYGIDYLFGKYRGKPQSVEQNAGAAFYQKKQGVEIWRIMKSVAFAAPTDRFVIVHVRGDRTIDETALAHLLGCGKADLMRGDVNSLGLEYGTVNPFVRRSVNPVLHIFDRDLIEGQDYPNDDIVLTSSGDPQFYVAFDVRRYLTATTDCAGEQVVFALTGKHVPSWRIVARRRVIIIGGDSGVDTFDFSKLMLHTLRQKLEKDKAYFGDRSLARVDTRSDPALAGSIDTAVYGKQLRARVVEMAAELQKAAEQRGTSPIVTFSSMAMHGAAGEILRETRGIEYVGPQEALLQILSSLEATNVEIIHTALLGLSSAYDKELSAFAGDVLNRTLPADDNVKRQIEEFVHDCKTGKAQATKFYETVKKILQRATRGKIDTLRNRNVAIILGASELEMFANTDRSAPEDFSVIKSNDATVVAAQIAKTSADKIRLVLIRPIQAVAELIAQKTLETTV